jgi:hypothetical protein
MWRFLLSLEGRTRKTLTGIAAAATLLGAILATSNEARCYGCLEAPMLPGTVPYVYYVLVYYVLRYCPRRVRSSCWVYGQPSCHQRRWWW